MFPDPPSLFVHKLSRRFQLMKFITHLGDCRQVLKTIPDASIDAVVTDPPYAEIDRKYGRLTEPQWHDLMNEVTAEVRRVLKPTGSAVFILQPNSEKVGRMRLWLWDFLVKWGREWNLIQDVYWWNTTTPPTVHCHRDRGLMRPSVKPCLWFGSPDCYKDQTAILWEPADATKAIDTENRALKYRPSGVSMRTGRCAAASKERGGSTPFNLLPLSASGNKPSVHGARTPYRLAEWWIKYISPKGGTILDPFMGVATIGEAAIDLGRKYIGIEQMPEYHAAAVAALEAKIVPDLFDDEAA